MTHGQKISQIQSKITKYNILFRCISENKKALKRETDKNALQRAASLFSFPFGKEAFGTLFSAIGSLTITIIFANCAIFVVLAVIFCAIVDVLFLPLFGIFYPFAVLYFLLFKRARIRCFKKRIAQAEREIKQYDIVKLQRELVAEERALDEYIRDYDPNPTPTPPVTPVSLPSYATDVTLDIHPGDY